MARAIWHDRGFEQRDNHPVIAVSWYDAQAFVRSTGARFLLKDCYSPQVLPTLLGSMILDTKHFGCATLYQVRTQG